MMKPKHGVASLLLAIFSLSVSFSSHAHDPSKPDEPYHPTDLKELHSIVESIRQYSTPEQQAEMDKLSSTAEAELKLLSVKANAARRQKIILLLQEKVDQHALHRAEEDELKAAAELSKKTDATLVSLSRIMTPDQRAHFRDHVAQHHD